MSSKYVVVVRQRETKRDDKSVGRKEKGEIKSDEDRVILRDEKMRHKGTKQRRETKREKESKRERSRHPKQNHFLIVQIFFERLFPFFLLTPFECVRE